MLLVIMALCTSIVVSAYSNEETELMFCHLLRKTPNYQIFNLQKESSCLGQAKIFDNVVCLRDNYMNVLEDTCFATMDVMLLQSYKSSDLMLPWISAKTITSSTSTWMDSPNNTALDGSSVVFGVDVVGDEKAEKQTFGQSKPTIASDSSVSSKDETPSKRDSERPSGQSKPSMASASSVSSKDETPSKRDSEWPSEQATPTEKIGNGFSSALSTGLATQSRTVVRSELSVVGTGNDKVLVSQGLEIGSNAAVNVTFVGPETLKVTQRSDISLQKEEKEIHVSKKQDSKDNNYSTCYKGV